MDTRAEVMHASSESKSSLTSGASRSKQLIAWRAAHLSSAALVGLREIAATAASGERDARLAACGE